MYMRSSNAEGKHTLEGNKFDECGNKGMSCCDL